MMSLWWMRLLNRIGVLSLIAMVVALMATPAQAIPLLQLYIEGATYDDGSETWEITAPTDQPLRLWAIGNVDGPGGKGTLSNVRLAIAYDSVFGPAPSFTITPSTTGGYGGFVDPSIAPSPTFLGVYTDGSVPVIIGSTTLAPHGVYGPGTHWQEFDLGEFSLTDSPIADFVDSFPSAPVGTSGQINVYEITVSGLPAGATIHFDLYGTYAQGGGAQALVSTTNLKATFAPYSHDAGSTVTGSTVTDVAEPGSLALLGGSLLLFAGMAYGRRRLAPSTHRSDAKAFATA